MYPFLINYGRIVRDEDGPQKNWRGGETSRDWWRYCRWWWCWLFHRRADGHQPGEWPTFGCSIMRFFSGGKETFSTSCASSGLQIKTRSWHRHETMDPSSSSSLFVMVSEQRRKQNQLIFLFVSWRLRFSVSPVLTWIGLHTFHNSPDPDNGKHDYCPFSWRGRG